jgi:hypothetical protein
MKSQVDPRRFIGKSFTRRKAFPNSVDDYSIWIDGLMVGRIMEVPRAGHKTVWYWSINGPYFPGPKSPDGEAASFEAARDSFKAKFWEWHVWAMKREDMAAWEGADA